MDASRDAVVILNIRGGIISANHSFTAICGFIPIELIGRSMNVLFSPKHHDRDFLENIWSTLKHIGYWEGELWHQHKGGEDFPISMGISEVRDQTGSVHNYVCIYTDITEQKRKEHDLNKLAHHDTLTGLPNRKLFNDRLMVALSSAQRDNSRMALIFMDLDGFKPINDRLGHQVGDVVLKTVAKRLENSVRDSDTPARLGGDEFAVILPGIDKNENLEAVAEKILHRIMEPMEIKGEILSVGTSMGISLFPEHAKDKESMIKYADEAMYAAKKSGKGRWQYYSS